MKPNENDAFDTTSLFMMQLACIVNMVQQWSNLILRVCITEDSSHGSFSSSVSSQVHYDRLKHLLKKLRISAEIYPVNNGGNLTESQNTSNPERYLKRWVLVYINSICYFICIFSVNELITSNSSNTVITFIYLPSPSKEEEAADTYLAMLDMISKDLPPTMFVHGVSTVTSTTL